MEYRRFQNKVFVRIDRGEDIQEQRKRSCGTKQITLAEVKALGALSEFTVGLFNPDTKQYDSHTYHELTEITSLWGTVTTREGEHYDHLHLSAAGQDNRALGGHMSRAVVGGTCEMVLDVVDGTVERQMSDEIGLNLFKFL